MPDMGFDEVSYAVYEEEPEPPRRPRRLRRLAVVAATTALGLGALVSGASAVTDSHHALTARQERHVVRSTQLMHHHHGLCPNMGSGSSAAY
jgi:anti-sigma factor RsiW